MKNRQGTISYNEKRGDWVGRVTVGYDATGKQLRKALYGKSYEEVLEKMKKFQAASFSLNIDGDKISFGEWFQKWLNGLKAPDIKPRSFTRYETLWRLYISKAPFSNKVLRSVTFSDIKGWYGSLRKAGVSLGTIRYINLLVRSSLSVAVQDALIRQNPTNRIAFGDEIKEERIQALTAAEQAKLVDYLYSSTSEPLREVILFGLGTGMRLGEILCLRWTDLDLELGAVHVTRSLERIKNNKGIYVDLESMPKSPSSVRDVPLPAPTLSMLMERRQLDDSLVFPGTIANGGPKDKRLRLKKDKSGFRKPRVGKKYIDNKTPSRHVKRICESLNITSISFHGLRHSYATRLFEKGVPLKTVQKLLGHADLATTNRVYVHVMHEEMHKSVSLLDELLSGKTPPGGGSEI